jgi:hypothetical protein
MFDLLVILVLVCIFLGQCFFLISLTLFIHTLMLPCSPNCVFKIGSVTDDHYSPSYCFVLQQPPLTFEHAANGFICGFLLPYSIRLILVTLLYWFNLYLSLYSGYPTSDCVLSISMFWSINYVLAALLMTWRWVWGTESLNNLKFNMSVKLMGFSYWNIISSFMSVIFSLKDKCKLFPPNSYHELF